MLKLLILLIINILRLCAFAFYFNLTNYYLILKGRNTYKVLQTLLLLFLLLSLSPEANAADTLHIDKQVNPGITSYTGDNQQARTGRILTNPLRVKVTDENGHPLANIPVVFEELSGPQGSAGLIIDPKISATDSAGIAVTQVTLGTKKGEYTLLARIKGSADNGFVIFRFSALANNWLIMLIFGLLGGLGLFLLGMNMMSTGMQKSAGDKMRSILSSLTRNRIYALGLGTFVTMVIQSSSATTVMLISFVNAGLIKFAQSLGIILGADIGTTITAQLIAFKLTDYALLMIALGFAVQTFPKKEKIKYTGEAILGFGILFFGMHIMSEAMYPLRTYEPFIQFILKLENPVTGIITGALFTALIQSSGAFIGIMIVLATQGLLSLEASVPLLLGANIGTAVTAILASINISREAKRVALAHTLFKIMGVLIIVWWIPDFIRLIKAISPAAGHSDQMNLVAAELPRQIANAHTLFNVLITLILLPFLNTFAKLIERIIPVKTEEKTLLKTKYLRDEPDMPPSLALSLVKEEIVHLAHIVQDMVNNFLSPFVVKEHPDVAWMMQKEEEVDFLTDSINNFVLKTASSHTKKERINEAFEMLYTVKEFEQIADIVSALYLEKAGRWVNSDLEFSEEGKKELSEFHLQVEKQISRAIAVFREYNLEKALLMEKKHQKYKQVALEFQRSHYKRLAGLIESSVKTSKTHLELMTLLATIYSHATNVARIILQEPDKLTQE